MGKAFFTVFLKLISAILGVFTRPVDDIIVNFLPDVSSLLNTFQVNVYRYVGSGLGFFAHLLPPTTRTLITIYLGFLLVFYTIAAAIHVVLWVITLLKNIKVW